MIYAEKLKQFNSTEKYKNELELLKMLLVFNGNVSKNILDYGCGNGDAARFLIGEKYYVDGYDKTHHNPNFNYKKDSLNTYDTVYFLHSFAHIENIKEVLIDLVCKKIIVITPNKEWLKLNHSDSYQPDPTVINHYSKNELQELFESLNFAVDVIGSFGNEKNNQRERIFIIANKK